MGIDNSFITTLIDTGVINEVQRQGITADFLSEDCRGVFNYVLRHVREYKTVPSRDSVLRAHPNFEFAKEEEPEPMAYYIDELRKGYRRAVLERQLDQIAQVYLEDDDKAEDLLRETLTEIKIAGKQIEDVDVAASSGARLETYLTRMQNPGATGVLSNWPTLDYQTLGWQPEEFIVLVGEKYVGKSWTMISLALQAALQKQRVLFVTKEMSQEAIMRRLDSLIARVSFEDLRRGELSDAERGRLEKALSGLQERTDFHFRVARQGVNTIDDIEQRAAETGADIILGDSIYLFDPSVQTQSSRGVTGEVARRLAISQRCKLLATRLGVPFICSVQAGRAKKNKDGSPSLDDIEWSNAFSQDADTVFFTQRDDLDRELRRAHLFLLKSRDGDLAEFYINQDFKTMDFSERAETSKPTTTIFKEDDVIDYGEE